MSMLDTAIADFGSVLGFNPGDLENRDHVAIDMDGSGQLHVERRDEHLLVYLAREIDVGVDRLTLYRTALRSVHFENGLPARVQCALHGDSLVFLVRYDADEVSAQSLEATVDILTELHDRSAR